MTDTPKIKHPPLNFMPTDAQFDALNADSILMTPRVVMVALMDIQMMLSEATRDELQAIMHALDNEKFDGLSYYGPCGCLIGTIGRYRWTTAHPESLLLESIGSSVASVPETPEGQAYIALVQETMEDFGASTVSPAETFVMNIRDDDDNTVHSPYVQVLQSLFHRMYQARA